MGKEIHSLRSASPQPLRLSRPSGRSLTRFAGRPLVLDLRDPAGRFSGRLRFRRSRFPCHRDALLFLSASRMSTTDFAAGAGSPAGVVPTCTAFFAIIARSCSRYSSLNSLRREQRLQRLQERFRQIQCLRSHRLDVCSGFADAMPGRGRHADGVNGVGAFNREQLPPAPIVRGIRDASHPVP